MDTPASTAHIRHPSVTRASEQATHQSSSQRIVTALARLAGLIAREQGKPSGSTNLASFAGSHGNRKTCMAAQTSDQLDQRPFREIFHLLRITTVELQGEPLHHQSWIGLDWATATLCSLWISDQ